MIITKGFSRTVKVAVVGLGYVGLPLAVALARKHDVVGFDISERRISALRDGVDSTGEVAAGELSAATLTITGDPAELRGRAIFIVTVPTPIDEANRPDFRSMLKACELSVERCRRGRSSSSKAPSIQE